MAVNKEKVQDLIDDFVVNNVDQINEVATENPVLYGAVIDALNLLSKKFGTLQSVNVPKPAAPAAPKANALNPIVQEGAIFIDTKDNKTKVEKINFEDEIVTFTRVDNQSPIKLKFSVVNDALQRGDIKLQESIILDPRIKFDAKFIDKRTPREYQFVISNIDYPTETIQQTDMSDGYIKDFTFKEANDNIAFGKWQPITQAQSPLNPSIKIKAEFVDKRTKKEYEFFISNISYPYQVVEQTELQSGNTNSYTFEEANRYLAQGLWQPIIKGTSTQLNPLVKIGAEFIDGQNIIAINDIDFYNYKVNLVGGLIMGTADASFKFVNDKIELGQWVPKTQASAVKLNTLVDIGEIFEKTNGDIITIRDIDTDKNVVEYDSAIMGPNTFASFRVVNDFIDQGVWVHNPLPQSNTFGALTLNPSVQVGQKYIDLDDDSNFSVLLIDQKKQVVTINWNEDDIEAEVDFEDFNDNLQAATWVLAPDQAQAPTTEADILEAIEGLELIGDAESKKEIAELKKQLKQLKKKKP
jgi:hypothetical protein